MKRVKKIVLLSIAIYFISIMLLYFLQKNLVFQATALKSDYVFKFNQPFEEHFMHTEDGETLNGLWFKPNGKSKGLIIYFHGNRDNLQRWGNYAVDFTKLDYEVLMVDYRSYGKSTGQPNEENLYKDAALIIDWAKKKTEHKKLIIYGRSLGAAIATQASIKTQPNLLILETPFDEIKSAIWVAFKPVTSIFPLRYNFPTKDFIVQVKSKKIIFHGTNDRIVSLKAALRLKPLLKKNDEFIVIPQGTHRNLSSFKQYKTKLAEVLN